MSISASQVKELRERTGAGMMECKSVLTEAGGDMDTAIELLRKKGLAKADKKAGRVAAEGVISVHVVEDGRSGAMVEVNCETDFVAKNEDFQGFAQDVAKLAASHEADSVDALLGLGIQNGTVEEVRRGLISKLGENINVRRFVRYARQDAGAIASYVHGGRIGVLVDVAGTASNLGELARDVAMHVAASRPEFVRAEDVPAERVGKEKEILVAQAADSGKPAEIVEKMISGRLNKMLAEISLLSQPFVKNPDQTVADLQKSFGDAQVQRFTRFEVGEGIEKAEGVSFAEEVMAQVRG
ncbi:translation elongation factor Ts [Thermithiobacillus plumbiphilus]|uniref:Elongation factor Ts n=1 Tax=Thermithiobacillus plumbiphilus TaxID=1729899 RepID=A0ABU9D3M7_9PROT